MDDDKTLYFPGLRVTVVAEDEPANEAGFGLLPETVIVKSEGLLLPPVTFVVTCSVPNNPGGGIGKGVGISGGVIGSGAGRGKMLSFWTGMFFFAAYPSCTIAVFANIRSKRIVPAGIAPITGE
jgi:hypothetical protein